MGSIYWYANTRKESIGIFEKWLLITMMQMIWYKMSLLKFGIIFTNSEKTLAYILGFIGLLPMNV